MTQEEQFETRLSTIEKTIGLVPGTSDYETRLQAIENYINSETSGSISSIVYNSVDDDGNVTDTETFKLVDSNAVNRLKAYVDTYLKENITEELTSEIKENINDLKNYVGFSKDSDTNLTSKIQNLVNEVYNQSSETISDSRLDTIEENIEKIANVLKEDASLDIELEDYNSSDNSKLLIIENNISVIIKLLKAYGYNISSTGTSFYFPKGANYLSTDANGKIKSNTASSSVAKGDNKLITSSAVASSLREFLESGDYAELGVTSLEETKEWSSSDLFSEIKYTISNNNQTFYKDFFIDTTGLNASFVVYSENENTEWPILAKENTIIYVPAYYSGEIVVTSQYGNLKLLTYSGEYINFTKTNGDNNYSAEFDYEDCEIISDVRYIKVVTTKKDFIKNIKINFSEDFCLKVKNNKIIVNVPITDADGNSLVNAVTLARATKKELGLENVNNTSDYNKPISIQQQAAFDTEANERKIADENLTSLLETETNERKIADENLKTKISIINENIINLTNEKKSTDENLTSLLETETNERKTADENLETKINAIDKNISNISYSDGTTKFSEKVQLTDLNTTDISNSELFLGFDDDKNIVATKSCNVGHVLTIYGNNDKILGKCILNNNNSDKLSTTNLPSFSLNNFYTFVEDEYTFTGYQLINNNGKITISYFKSNGSSFSIYYISESIVKITDEVISKNPENITTFVPEIVSE